MTGRFVRAAGIVMGLAGIALLAWSVFAAGRAGPSDSPAAPDHRSDRVSLTDDAGLAALVEAALSEDPTASPDWNDPYFAAAAGPVYVALRAGGERLADGWSSGGRTDEAIVEAVEAARANLDPGELDQVDSVELSVGAPVEALNLAEGLPGDIRRGVLGMELRHRDRVSRLAPTEMIARNLGFEGALDDYSAEIGISRDAFPGAVSAATFEADQFLVDLEPPEAIAMTRGNTVVPASAVNAASTQELADGLGDWLVRQVHDDGRMTYKYWPSRGEESEANNTIRQWMATIALGRLAAARDDAAIWELARWNIEYNLAVFYETDGDLGLIAEADGDVKLGAVALAALALAEHPARADFADHEASLRRTVDALWNEDGSFASFYRPAGRNDNQNFYPGEALLLWSSLLAEHQDPVLLDRFMRSFAYYRDWHRAQRNPAFVPWHTQAYVAVWELTGDPELRDFVLEMNDWLVPMQQWDDAPYDDVRGRFYDPDHPEYGPPHASSDGVYLEGLAAAHRLAATVGDAERTERYRLAIARALRNAMQLQFADDVDMFYVSKRDPVAGGMRTTVYDNEIRVDNVQHNLLGILFVLDQFTESDYRIE